MLTVIENNRDVNIQFTIQLYHQKSASGSWGPQAFIIGLKTFVIVIY